MSLVLWYHSYYMKRLLTNTAFILFLILITPHAAGAATRSLTVGVRGSDVVALQNTLIEMGYLGAGYNTGYFGALTQAAVKKYQCDKGIICSGSLSSGYGVVGPRTQASLGAFGSSPSPAAGKKFEISGWIPYWRAATGTADTLPHLSQLTSVLPFGYTMKTNGTLADTAKLKEEPWTSFMTEARRQGVLVVPTVMWGDGERIHKILSNSATRIALEDEIAEVVKENNFDGIDIDFEAKKHETLNYFSTFLKGLDMRLGNKLLYCTVEARMPLEERYLEGQVIPPDAEDYANDYKEMNKYCDRIEIMAYDQGTVAKRLNRARTAPYAPVADPSWVESLVNLAAKDISKSKIILGIPTYGYEYLVTPQPNGTYTYKRLWAFNPKYALDIAAKLGLTPKRTSANELGLTYDAKLLEPAPSTDTTIVQQATPTTTTAENSGSQVSGGQPFNYMTWSDAAAIEAKVELAKRLGLRGVALFKFDGGQDPLTWNVLK